MIWTKLGVCAKTITAKEHTTEIVGDDSQVLAINHLTPNSCFLCKGSTKQSQQ